MILAMLQPAAEVVAVHVFFGSLEAGWAWRRVHPEDAGQDIIKQYQGLDTRLNHQEGRATLPLFAANSASFDHARYQAFGEYMQANGLIKTVAPMTRYSLEQ